MKFRNGKFLAATIAVMFALIGLAMITGAQQAPDAPAGFDGLTNGSVDQATMNYALATFEEIEHATPDGLGPVYNATSCTDCHQSVIIGGASQNLEFRAGHNEPSRPAATLDPQRARNITWGSGGTFVAATAVTANGTPIPERSLVNQRAICPDAVEHLTDVDNIRTARLSLGLEGDGFVEAVPDSTFLALAKANGGEAIQVPVLEAAVGVTEVGKFGWKDQHASLLSFASDAYFNEMGITNALNPTEATEVCNPPGIPEPNDAVGPQEPIDDIHMFATFMRALKAPPRGPITPQVTQGQTIFESIGCNKCHVEDLVTAPANTSLHGGEYVVSAAIGGMTIHPFGDYLLHDVGTGDGIVQNGPGDTQYKVRTMPLWGLRTRTQLMHDAQSATFSDAIQRHTNEAGTAAANFQALTAAQKALLYQFLGSL
jgi:CxxC motif-containing protein (DUF1111 family)